MKSLPVILAMSGLVFASPSLAEGDLSRAEPTQIVIEMGTVNDGTKSMFFKPNHLDLETGKAYEIVLHNVDSVKHEFAGHDFISRVFTRKVEITTASGDLVAEVKGNPAEIEVGAGQKVSWFIVPVQTGENIAILCDIDGHLAAGMAGTVTIH